MKEIQPDPTPEISFGERLSGLLYRSRVPLLTLIILFLCGVIGYTIYSVLQSRADEQSAVVIYQMRQAYDKWLETVSKDSSDPEEPETAEHPEKEKLEAVLAEIRQSRRPVEQVWAQWLTALKAHREADLPAEQQALETVLESGTPRFQKLASIRLANNLYRQNQVSEAVTRWEAIANLPGDPTVEQMLAAIFLGNHYARIGNSEESIRYWEQVLSLHSGILKKNGLPLDQETENFLSESPLARRYQNMFSNWEVVAKNQLLFQKSQKLSPSAPSADPAADLKTSN